MPFPHARAAVSAPTFPRPQPVSLAPYTREAAHARSSRRAPRRCVAPSFPRIAWCAPLRAGARPKALRTLLTRQRRRRESRAHTRQRVRAARRDDMDDARRRRAALRSASRSPSRCSATSSATGGLRLSCAKTTRLRGLARSSARSRANTQAEPEPLCGEPARGVQRVARGHKRRKGPSLSLGPSSGAHPKGATSFWLR